MMGYRKISILSICILILSLCLSILITPLYAQYSTYPYTFGTTSIANYGSYPYTFGTTSISNYGSYPLYSGYTNSIYPYFSGGLLGGGYYGSLYGNYGGYGYYGGGLSPYNELMKIIQYYQYLTYAYQFYMVARQTPMFYQRDIVADYIGSALYSFVDKSGLSPEQAIISFIQQNLL